MARYEGSPQDRRNDRAMAKRRGMTLKEWEDSPEDAAMDAAEQRKLDRQKQKRPRSMGNTADRDFAFSKPRT